MTRRKDPLNSINCSCVQGPAVQYSLGVVQKKLPCKTCGKKIHSSHWYSATELQKLARQRNWDRAMAKGATQNLIYLGNKCGFTYMNTLKQTLLQLLDYIDRDWLRRRQQELNRLEKKTK